ncbi:MAG: MBL fold metallo-hydrolase [Acidimicrobiia bacterium]
MQLTVLGSNASSPSRTNAASGYLVQWDGVSIWMDAGPGTFMRLAEVIDPGLLDAVVLSHSHVDHCADVVGLYGYLAYGPSGPTPVPVYAPEGSRELLAAFARADDDHVFHQVLDFREVGPGDRVSIGTGEMTFGAAVHPVPAVGIRIDADGGSLVYSGDTGPGGDLLSLAADASTFLCEATLDGARGPSTYEFHMTAAEAGDIASWSGAGQLILTHIPSIRDIDLMIAEAAGSFQGQIEYAAPGSVFEISTTG